MNEHDLIIIGHSTPHGHLTNYGVLTTRALAAFRTHQKRSDRRDSSNNSSTSTHLHSNLLHVHRTQKQNVCTFGVLSEEGRK